ncbi:MAG: hypothetical protein FWF82_01575 [Oscillospiraceae bacterium]|nr:hypothetical protein [Oscillospiraceae bacterium]
MKRKLSTLLTLLLICLSQTLTVTANADVLVTPEDGFYKRHQSEIKYLGRDFVINGADGSARFENSPGSVFDKINYPNGKTIRIEYSCLYDGEFWGYSPWYGRWVKTSDLLVLYDYVAFSEEFESDLHSYNGDREEITETKSAVVWAWPGSGVPLYTVENLDPNSFNVAYAYTDSDGREWGFVPYMYGDKNIWFCLSDPLGSDIPAFTPARDPVPWVSETEHTNIPREYDAVIFIIVLVAVLVIGTGVLIKVFWKANNKGGNENE